VICPMIAAVWPGRIEMSFIDARKDNLDIIELLVTEGELSCCAKHK
jgi:hypothetical protein